MAVNERDCKTHDVRNSEYTCLYAILYVCADTRDECVNLISHERVMFSMLDCMWILLKTMLKRMRNNVLLWQFYLWNHFTKKNYICSMGWITQSLSCIFKARLLIFLMFVVFVNFYLQGSKYFAFKMKEKKKNI